ncbi:MAG: hypothetical protein RL660_1476 [Bacteroidota bacterium]
MLLTITAVAYGQTTKKTKRELKAEAKEKEAAQKAKTEARKREQMLKQKEKEELAARNKRKTVKKRALPKYATKEYNYGLIAATDGFGFGVHRMERNPSDLAMPAYGFFMELAEYKDPRERRRAPNAQQPVNGIEPTPYIYGKIYNNYQLKVGYIRRRPVSGKLDASNVRIHHFWAAGLNLGIFKPYLLNLDRNGATTVEQYNQDNAVIFLNRDYIVGSAGFMEGLGLLTYQFGALGRTGFQFEYQPTRYRGLIGEIGFETKLGLGKGNTTMANTQSRLIYPSVYAAVRLVNLKD